MAKIIIDEREYEVRDGQNMLQATLSVGLDLPYFCWHPAMGSIGACRQCAVRIFRDANDAQGKLAMACMTPAVDGTRISIDDREARDFRASVIEWLMLNHPHDCPICDEGGECHLQDMTVMTGHDYRRFRGKKRTFVNRDLGPLVNHEMNRCIQCYRCVRFYRDYAGGRDFDVFGIRSRVYFGRQTDGVLESEFSGNLVEVCPTGVFTDKTLKEHYTRKWDLQTAPSVCVHCGVGCNTIAGERYGTLRRILNRYNSEVNGYFLCDRGRYGYEFVNGNKRIRGALVRDGRGAQASPIDRDEALRRAAAAIRESGGVIGIGSPRASLEANFALLTLVGRDNFYAGVSERDWRLERLALDIMNAGPAAPASLADAARADAALVLGEDVTQTAPMLSLALRQSVRRAPMRLAAGLRVPEWDDAGVRHVIQQDKGPFYIASSQGTRLDDVATRTYRASSDDIARLGFAVAHAIDGESPAVRDLPARAAALAREIATALLVAQEPLVVSGSGCGSESVLRAAANVVRALCRKGRPAKICLVAPECDGRGLALMGGRSLESALDAVASGRADTVIVVENDLYRRAPAALVDALIEKARAVVVLDHTMNGTSERANIVLPAATFAEGDGVFVNNEGRAQRFYQVFLPMMDIQESWRSLAHLMVASGRAAVAPWQSLDDIDAALAAAMPVFAPIAQIAPPAGFRIAGQRIARESGRYSGRTAMWANVSVHEPKPPEDLDSPLAFSMEGYQQQPPPALVPRFWAPAWNSVQSLNKYQQEINGPLRGDDPGRRLIEPPEDASGPYFDGIPSATETPVGGFLLVPAHHIFGSEELSAQAPAIASMSPRPYVGLAPDDANGMLLKDGDEVEVMSGNWSVFLPVRVIETLSPGMIALPRGLGGVDWLDLPVLGGMRRAHERRGPA